MRRAHFQLEPGVLLPSPYKLKKKILIKASKREKWSGDRSCSLTTQSSRGDNTVVPYWSNNIFCIIQYVDENFNVHNCICDCLLKTAERQSFIVDFGEEFFVFVFC